MIDGTVTDNATKAAPQAERQRAPHSAANICSTPGMQEKPGIRRGSQQGPAPWGLRSCLRRFHSQNHGLVKAGKDLKDYHRFTEWFGLEGTLKIIWFHPPAMSRDISHQPRVLSAPSNLALSTAREGAATASLGNVFSVSPPSW